MAIFTSPPPSRLSFSLTVAVLATLSVLSSTLAQADEPFVATATPDVAQTDAPDVATAPPDISQTDEPIVATATPAVAPVVTLYNDSGLATPVSQSPDAVYTGLGAYDPLVLTAPLPPDPPTTEVGINIPIDPVGAGYPLSIPQRGNFLGFSIELSVATSLLGSVSGLLKPIFLNYMANIQTRAGVGPSVRVGGNTQEDSVFVDEIHADAMIKVNREEGVTATPLVYYSDELLYVMSNISSLVGVEWFFGLNFNSTFLGQDVEGGTLNDNIPLAAGTTQRILGPYLRGIAMGNEPDLYVAHWDRPEGYGVPEYNEEFTAMRNYIMETAELSDPSVLMGPNVCCFTPGFGLQDIFDSGWLQQNLPFLAAVTVQHYPNNNCKINGNIVDPQAIFYEYLNHTSAQTLTAQYLDGSAQAVAAGKEMIMLEFNTASCGGFPGLSDSFGATLWLTDWALQLAWGNFSAALMHVGGQNTYYNPFTPPPYVDRGRKEWTTGSIYYSTLVVAEAFGRNEAAQVIDLLPGGEDIFHPSYIIYEHGVPARAVLFNYVTDASGASDYTATLSLAGTDTPLADHVNVRYLRAADVGEHEMITWANQTLGRDFSSDGRLYGDVETVYVPCTDGKCYVRVPAPSIALVFLTDAALEASTPPPDATATFRTTAIGTGTATIDPEVLATGNGMRPPPGTYGGEKGRGAAGRPGVHAALGVGALALALAVGQW